MDILTRVARLKVFKIKFTFWTLSLYTLGILQHEVFVIGSTATDTQLSHSLFCTTKQRHDSVVIFLPLATIDHLILLMATFVKNQKLGKSLIYVRPNSIDRM